MKQGFWTSVLTPASAAVGAALVTPTVLGFSEPSSSSAILGAALVCCSAGGGLLLARLSRKANARLAEELRHSAEMALELRQLRPVAWEDDVFSPLVASVNGCLAAAGRVADDAEANSRRTAIELKLTVGQRRHLESVLAGLEDAVIVTDAFDEVAMLNAAAAAMFGIEGDLKDVAGRPIAAVVGEPKLANLIREVRQNGSGSRRAEELSLIPRSNPDAPASHYRVSLMRTDGEPRSTTSTTSAAAGGERAGGVVTVLRDTTREKELAQQKNDFVSSVTHELRTPLASIRAYVEMLVDGDAEDEAERQEFCEIIDGEASRLSSLIDNILNISRIESGLVKIDRRPHSPVLIAEKALGVIEPQAKLKNVEIKRELLPSIFQVIADGDLLYQVMLNLLSNAVKYTPEGGRVTLKCEVDEAAGMLVTKVIDNGAGIPEGDLPHVFEKFYRVERNSKMAKGTGLGLPLVKRVIEQDFGGRVWVESAVDEGSMFAFELPMVGRPATADNAGSGMPHRAAA